MSLNNEYIRRVEFVLYGRYTEDREIIQTLDGVKNKSDYIRAVLIDHIRGSRYVEQERKIASLEHELDVLRRVLEKVAR